MKGERPVLRNRLLLASLSRARVERGHPEQAFGASNGVIGASGEAATHESLRGVCSRSPRS